MKIRLLLLSMISASKSYHFNLKTILLLLATLKILLALKNYKNHANFLIMVIAFSCAMTLLGSYFLYAQTVLTTINLGPEAGSGLGPVRVAVNPITNRIYVSNRTTDNVSVIDGSNNQVVDTVSVGNGPEGIAVNPNTNMVYVVNSCSDTISVINGSNNRLLDTITVGLNSAGADAIAVNSNTNMVYAVAAGILSVIAGTNNQVVDTVMVGDTPVGITINTTNNLVYVTNRNSGDVTVIQDDGTCGT